LIGWRETTLGGVPIWIEITAAAEDGMGRQLDSLSFEAAAKSRIDQ
jgi:hypothetical protein